MTRSVTAPLRPTLPSVSSSDKEDEEIKDKGGTNDRSSPARPAMPHSKDISLQEAKPNQRRTDLANVLGNSIGQVNTQKKTEGKVPPPVKPKRLMSEGSLDLSSKKPGNIVETNNRRNLQETQTKKVPPPVKPKLFKKPSLDVSREVKILPSTKTVIDNDVSAIKSEMSVSKSEQELSVLQEIPGNSSAGNVNEKKKRPSPTIIIAKKNTKPVTFIDQGDGLQTSDTDSLLESEVALMTTTREVVVCKGESSHDLSKHFEPNSIDNTTESVKPEVCKSTQQQNVDDKCEKDSNVQVKDRSFNDSLDMLDDCDNEIMNLSFPPPPPFPAPDTSTDEIDDNDTNATTKEESDTTPMIEEAIDTTSKVKLRKSESFAATSPTFADPYSSHPRPKPSRPMSFCPATTANKPKHRKSKSFTRRVQHSPPSSPPPPPTSPPIDPMVLLNLPSPPSEKPSRPATLPSDEGPVVPPAEILPRTPVDSTPPKDVPSRPAPPPVTKKKEQQEKSDEPSSTSSSSSKFKPVRPVAPVTTREEITEQNSFRITPPKPERPKAPIKISKPPPTRPTPPVLPTENTDVTAEEKREKGGMMDKIMSSMDLVEPHAVVMYDIPTESEEDLPLSVSIELLVISKNKL